MNNSTPSNFTLGNLTTVGDVVHVSSFKEFYKVSAFFIAYVLLYMLTVPLIMKFGNRSWQLIGGAVASLRAKNVTASKVRMIVPK